ncbi:MAG: glycoside hydrolase family 140 protein [Acidobacteriota bacterium]|nr:glycoside hydrolase family 140 protein [Acidobacteriota bacterium]
MKPSRNSAFAVSVGMLASLFPADSAPKAKRMPQLKVSPNHHFIIQDDGKPFFYLADTAWELFHRLNRKDAAEYLKTRAGQGFTAIQAVALAEEEGLTVPNAYGKLPLIGKDPAKPATTPGANPGKPDEYDYWDHVEYIIDEANRNGMYIGLLPTWGRWVVKRANAPGEVIFTVENAQAYGEFLGKRFGKKGVIWILGGDRESAGFEDVWRSLAKGIAIGAAGKEDYDAVFMGFHPRGGGTSSTSFHTDAWLDVNMQQTGHGLAEQVQSWAKIAKDYQLDPPKPVIDAEPLYEDHPLAFQSRINGYSLDAHIRQRAYWDLFAGACGHTYGNHAVWQFYAPGRKPVNGPLMYWQDAVHRPGANEMQYVRQLIESRPILSRVPDQSLIQDELQGADHISATRGDGYAFIYDAQGRPFTVNMGKISGERVKARWFNPRSGDSTEAGEFQNQGAHGFVAPSEGLSSDWVLILDDASKGFQAPVKRGIRQ